MWFTRRIAASWASSRLALAVLATLLLAAIPTVSVAQDPPLRVLYLSQSVGFVHDTVRRPEGGLAPSEIALQEMARDSGAFTVALTQDARDLTPARLADLDVLIFSTTGALPIDRPTWDAIVTWVESGKGFIGIHSAADTQLDFQGGRYLYTEFIGGQFDGHPWTQGTPIRLSNLDPDNPLAATWPDGTDYTEEIYQYSGFNPYRVRVLQTLDMSYGPLRRPYPVPVTWVRQVGGGRLFYTNLGHTPSTWADPRFRDQIVTAIRWAGGQIDAETQANSEAQDRAALQAFAAAEGLAVGAAPDNLRSLANTIRDLQNSHPDKREGDAQAWDDARARLLSNSAFVRLE